MMAFSQKSDPRLIHSRSIFAAVVPTISATTHPDPKKRGKARTDLMLKALRLARPVHEYREV